MAIGPHEHPVKLVVLGHLIVAWRKDESPAIVQNRSEVGVVTPLLDIADRKPEAGLVFGVDMIHHKVKAGHPHHARNGPFKLLVGLHYGLRVGVQLGHGLWAPIPPVAGRGRVEWGFSTVAADITEGSECWAPAERLGSNHTSC